MNFEESVEYLISLGNEVSAMKLGLENTRKLLTALDDPHTRYLKVQVAGTNGKGSVCAFLNSICNEAGIRTGMYTSPHLVSVTERVQIDGLDISDREFAHLAMRVRETSETLVGDGAIENVPTFFEQVTAIALLAFAEAKVELAILETGLGGRLDATTAANAEIAAITRIDHDHQQYLGNTIEEIAAEKAAIIHEGSKVIIGEQKSTAMEVILERCRNLGVIPTLTTEHRDPTGKPGEYPSLGLPGKHQIENARVAEAIARKLRAYFSITDGDIITGLESARHPGRLEHFGRFILDGAHNAGGVRALRDYLDETVHRPVTLIFGVMEDKAVSEMTSILFPKANRLILTRPDNSRALSIDDLLKGVPANLDPAKVFLAQNGSEAIIKAREVSADDDVIVVTGSLYLVGEIRGQLASECSEKTKTKN